MTQFIVGFGELLTQVAGSEAPTVTGIMNAVREFARGGNAGKTKENLGSCRFKMADANSISGKINLISDRRLPGNKIIWRDFDFLTFTNFFG